MEHQEHKHEELEPNMQRARQTSGVAHSVVIKLKEMGLPENLDPELASLSTDMGDIWNAQRELADLLESFLKAPQEWETVADHLVDLRSCLDHIDWHLRSVRRPMNRLTQYAYRQASNGGPSADT